MRKMVTGIEKLDAAQPGLGTAVRIWLDHGTTVEQVQRRLEQEFGVSVNKGVVAYYRRNRWGPLRERIQDESVAVKAIIETVGGDAGVDDFMSARLVEEVRALAHDELIDAKELFVKIRAQNLKEQEFLFKSGQLKLKADDDGEDDPAAEAAKTKRVMNKIRGIFGLSPLPDESAGAESKASTPATPAENEASSEPQTEPVDGAPAAEEPELPANEGEGPGPVDGASPLALRKGFAFP